MFHMTATLTIRQYAAAHKLDPDVFTVTLSESHDRDVSADDEATIAELDQIREDIDEMAVDDLVDARDRLADAREDVKAAEADLQRAVRDALADGVKAPRIAEVLGVSRARVYQLRDGKR